MKPVYFVVLPLMLAFIVLTIVWAGAGIPAYVDPASLAVVLSFPILMSFATHSLREIGRSFRLAFGAGPAGRPELERALLYFRGVGRHLLYGGGFGLVTGLVALLSSFEEPRQIGRGLAVAVITTQYAILLNALLAWPCQAAIRRRLLDVGD